MSPWVCFKALFLMFLISALVQFSKMPLELGSVHTAVTAFSDFLAQAAAERSPWMRALDLEATLPSLQRLEWGLSYAIVLAQGVWAPMSWFLGLLVTSAGACLLLPLCGVAGNRVSFPQVFVVGAYVRSLVLLELLPGFDTFLVSILVLLVHAWALAQVFRLRFSQGLFCLSALPLFYLAGGLFVLGVLVFAGFFSTLA